MSISSTSLGKIIVVAFSAVALLPCGSLRAEVILPSIFCDHMVLQHGATLPVWGKASPGEVLTVSILGHSARTIAAPDGNWQVTLPPLVASPIPQHFIVQGNNRIEIQDVLIGDVWICAGDSNMEYPLSESTGGRDTQGEPSDHNLRFFYTPESLSEDPSRSTRGRWMTSSTQNSPSFSAVGYFFARDLRSSQRLPIGIIQCTEDESPAQVWVSHGGLSKKPSFSEYLTERVSQTADQKTPSSLFNRLVFPLIPYAITGVIWYQGESNEGFASLEYRRLFPRLIRDWREHWKQGPFPFFFVLAAGFGDQDGPVVESFNGDGHQPRRALPWLREGQSCALILPNTGMADATDLGMPDEHQPPDKLDVGRRLALLARKRVYGEPVVDSGPRYCCMSREGAKIRMRFQDVGGGLILGATPFQGDDSRAMSQTKPTGFAVAGKDGKWYAATALIDGSSILLSSDAVQHPMEARYNWSGYPRGNLYNKDGLPAAPFRTDTVQP